MTKAYGKSCHTENYRVVYDVEFPRTAESAHNAFYFNDFNIAQRKYFNYVMMQTFEEKRLDRVSFEIRDTNGVYHSMFSSFVYHTAGSYGLVECPDE